jgi:hypothetical protein
MHTHYSAGSALAAGRGIRPAAPTIRVFERITPDHFVHIVHDHGCEPLIKPSEIAVVTDQPQLYPEYRGWYLIEYSNGKTYRGRERRVRCICQARFSERYQHWWLSSPAPTMGGVIQMDDGPYADFNDIAEKVLGRVVGIYKPAHHSVETPPAVEA